MEISRILKRPLITEKVTKMSPKIKGGKERYAFVVDMDATKDDISKAVAKMYEVEVEDVNTCIIKGKPKSRYSRGVQVKGYTSSFKKAYVTVKEGQFIDFYNNLPE